MVHILRMRLMFSKYGLCIIGLESRYLHCNSVYVTFVKVSHDIMHMNV